jgi:hypothetical protein
VLTVRSQSRHGPIAGSEQHPGKLPYVAHREGRPWPSTGSSYPAASPGRTTPSALGCSRHVCSPLSVAQGPCRCCIAKAQCGRDGPQSRESLEEALRSGTPGPPCRLLGRLARHVGGRVVRSEERRDWTRRTNLGRAGAIVGWD